MTNNSAIGIFDSGVGGLTVLKEMIKTMPEESTIYLGDTARVPYGIRSPQTVTKYSFENTYFLLSRNVKMVVVACNTASSVSLELIKGKIQVPVIGVIGPGARAAVRATKSGKIGVIGTDATIKSSAYVRAINAIDSTIEVRGLACPLFVPLAEEGWTEDRIASLAAVKYLEGLKHTGIDTLVLGCTHYPLLKNIISEIMGPDVTLIDSAVETAVEIRRELHDRGLACEVGQTPAREFFVTDLTERFVDVGGRFLGHKIENIKEVELQTEAHI